MLEADVKRVHRAGMELANQLRLAGKAEEANEIEIWILAVCKELEMR